MKSTSAQNSALSPGIKLEKEDDASLEFFKDVRELRLVLAGCWAMVIGFGYWMLTAFCISLGHSGALPAWVAAWLPSSIVTLIGFFYFTAEE